MFRAEANALACCLGIRQVSVAFEGSAGKEKKKIHTTNKTPNNPAGRGWGGGGADAERKHIDRQWGAFK